MLLVAKECDARKTTKRNKTFHGFRPSLLCRNSPWGPYQAPGREMGYPISLTDGMSSLAPPPPHARHKSTDADTGWFHSQWPSAHWPVSRMWKLKPVTSTAGAGSQPPAPAPVAGYLADLSCPQHTPHAPSSAIQRGTRPGDVPSWYDLGDTLQVASCHSDRIGSFTDHAIGRPTLTGSVLGGRLL